MQRFGTSCHSQLHLTRQWASTGRPGGQLQWCSSKKDLPFASITLNFIILTEELAGMLVQNSALGLVSGNH